MKPSTTAATDSRNAGAYTVGVSVAEPSAEPGLHLWPAGEAVAHAKPLPPRDVLVLDDVTDEEWESFFSALAEE